MRFSLINKSKMDFCKRLENLGHKCRDGYYPLWADTLVCLSGRPEEGQGVNMGLIAQAIFSDPTYLTHFIHELPRQDSIVLISKGMVIGVFSLREENKIIPLGLGVSVPEAVTLLAWEPETFDLPTQLLSGFKGILKVTKGGKLVELVNSPGIWASLAEVYPLEKLFTRPPHVMTPKQPYAGAIAVASSSEVQVPEVAIKHVLETPEYTFVSARGTTKKETWRRIQRSIERLEFENPIYRLDILKRR